MLKLYRISVYRDEKTKSTFRHAVEVLDDNKTMVVAFVVKKDLEQEQVANVIEFKPRIKKAA